MGSRLCASLLQLRVLVFAFGVCLFCLIDLRKQQDARLDGTVVEKDNPVVKMYAPSNSTSNVAVCLIVKNETLYLDEWLDYHIALGFSPIYIYDNSPDFELHMALHWVNSEIYTWYETRRDIHSHIRLIHFPVPSAQVAAYDRCIKKDASNSTFIALIDVDEFLVLNTFDNVVDFMDHHCDLDCGQLSINWRMMGTSNEKQYTPVPLLKRNLHFNDATSGTIKVIVRPSYVTDNLQWRHSVMLKKGHWIDTSGTRHFFRPSNWRRQSNADKPYDVALLYHYAFKSEGEFHYKKCIRGHSRGIGKSQTPLCNSPMYYKILNGTEFDDTAWRQLMRMVPKYRVYGEATNDITSW